MVYLKNFIPFILISNNSLLNYFLLNIIVPKMDGLSYKKIAKNILLSFIPFIVISQASMKKSHVNSKSQAVAKVLKTATDFHWQIGKPNRCLNHHQIKKNKPFILLSWIYFLFL